MYHQTRIKTAVRFEEEPDYSDATRQRFVDNFSKQIELRLRLDPEAKPVPYKCPDAESTTEWYDRRAENIRHLEGLFSRDLAEMSRREVIDDETRVSAKVALGKAVKSAREQASLDYQLRNIEILSN
ncbi:hypothetical protein KY331_00735 [Candidatus Woesearchaeota archaeon]|nr:hypothetical protein [Candidatus Woesearchaeota archaeon]